MTILLVLTNMPDSATAERMASVLVESGLAACVNIQQPVQSVYRWQGRVERAQEIPLIIKTTEASYNAVLEAIRMHHPYEVPEILALPVTKGFIPYMRWVAQSCTTPEPTLHGEAGGGFNV